MRMQKMGFPKNIIRDFLIREHSKIPRLYGGEEAVQIGVDLVLHSMDLVLDSGSDSKVLQVEDKEKKSKKSCLRFRTRSF